MYVEAYSGDDAVGTGEEASPVASLAKGLEVVSEKLGADPSFDGTAKIILGGGNYDVASTVEVTSAAVPDGGLIITNAEGEEPVLVGGITYDAGSAVKVSDDAILSRLHSDAAKQNLYALDLTTKLAKDDIPAVSYPGAYTLDSYLTAAGIDNPSDVTCEASFDGALMTVARWPNEGYAVTGTVVDPGVEGRYFADSYKTSESYIEPTAENLQQGFTIVSDYENLGKWQTADQALMFGYWYHDWATQTVPLKTADAANGTITSKYPSIYSVDAQGRYYVYNLLEEIDLPGEYFIDRTTGTMYFYMPEGGAETGTITISVLEEPLLALKSVNGVTVDGIAFEGSRGSGISITSGGGNVVQNCEMRNLASFGITAYSKNNILQNNYIHDTNGGIAVGSPDAANDTKYLRYSNNKVLNNEITRFSRIDKVYVDGISLSGVGNIASHNEIHDGEHLAIRFTGQYHEISNNEIYNVLQECDDAGAIYVGRTWLSRGNKVVNNYFHDLNTNLNTSSGGRSPVAGIFLDDHYAAAYIEGNIFADIYGDGVRSNRGREHTITNNIFINCSRYGISMTTLEEDDGKTIDDYSTQKNSLLNSPYQSEAWLAQFPEVAATAEEDWPKPEKYTITNNLTVNTETGVTDNCLSIGVWATTLATDISNNVTTDTDPGFADMASGDYSISAEELQTTIPGFKEIDFASIGRQVN